MRIPSYAAALNAGVLSREERMSAAKLHNAELWRKAQMEREVQERFANMVAEKVAAKLTGRAK